MPPLAFNSPRGRRVLWATVLGSGLASLDATVVNVALPAIGRDLGGGVSELAWVVNGYTLTLASLLLVGGALGDHHGRRRVFAVGVVWFTLASVACGLAGSTTSLVIARMIQGMGGGLLTPGSLAILGASFDREDRAAAIGAWSGLGGVAVALGPLTGGWLVQRWSWRVVFFLNVPLAVVALVLLRAAPETRDPEACGPIDVAGATLAALGLGAITFALTLKARGALALASGAGGALLFGAFLVVERRRAAPLVDLALFRSSQFAAANAETLIVYAALGGALFLLPMTLQIAAGYTPLEAGAALLPMTAMMLLLSTSTGRLARRIGPRAPMSVGPILAALGLAVLARRAVSHGYLEGVVPGALLLGLGLAFTVAPLTTTVISAAPPERAGVASAINNCIARTGSLLAVATLPFAIGLEGALEPRVVGAAFPRGMLIGAALCLMGGAIACLFVRRPPAPARAKATPSCPLDAPTLGPSGC
jgi:EmrB/QacA subfamily drug resistance transporter